MRISVALLFLLFSLTISGQNIEVAGGALHNNFFDTEGNFAYKSFSDKPHVGYSISIGIDDIKFDWLPLRFTLGYERYGGEIKASETGHMYSQSIDFEIRKSVFALGVYFINFKFVDHLDLNVGLQFSRLLDESITGSGESIYYSENLEPEVEKATFKGKKSNYGIRARLAYDFDLNARFAMSPQYDFYYGLSTESEDYPGTIQSFRHYFSLGFQVKVGK